MLKAFMNHIRLLKWINFLVLLISSLGFKSQDIRGSYFQVNSVGGYKYSGDLYLLTDLSTTVFRPYVLFDWGPQVDTLKFIQANTYGNTVVNKFTGSFTYGGPGF